MRSRPKFIRCIIILALIFLISFQSIEVNAQAMHAGERGAIQTLIDNAVDGATVVIPAGTFSETLTIDKNLTLVGTGNGLSILHPAGSGQRVITVTAGHNLAINNLFIQNGQAPGSLGGGIYMAGGNLTVDQSYFNNNSADYGGAIFLDSSSSTVTINNSYLIANTATLTGGAVYAKGNATLNQTYVSNNTAGSHGGGIHVDGNLTTWAGTFINNVAGGNGGGANVNNNVSVTLTNFTTNISGDLGGGILQWNPDKTVTISGANFSGNTAKNAGGGANLKSRATISETKFISNTVNAGTGTHAYGGGLYAEAGADITYARFIDNQALCNTCSLALGGGIYTSGVFNGTNILFARNAARYGSVINFTAATGWLNHVTIGQPTVGNSSAIRVIIGSSHLTMYNTIISNYEIGVYNQGTLTEGYNLWYGNSHNVLNEGGTVNAMGHDVTGEDPMFIDPNADDFHIKAFSPAIGAGTVTPSPVLYDLDIKDRNGRWDIGAYQFWTSYYLPILIK